MIDHAVMSLCARLPRGGFALAKAARRLLPSLGNYPARPRFAPIELCGDVSHNVFYSLAVNGYYAHQVVEDDLLALLARQSELIVDVGANIGYTAALLASCAPPSARILAYEPLPLCQPYLRQVAEKYPNVKVIGKAVGESSGTAQFLQRRSVDRSSLAGKGEAPVSSTFDVEITTLDSEFPEARVDLLKIDVEGFEPAVLKGARGMIERSRPIVVFEAYECEVLDFAVEFFRDIVGDFVVYAINSSGVLREFGQEPGSVPDTCNYVAWPNSRPGPAALDIPPSYDR